MCGMKISRVGILVAVVLVLTTTGLAQSGGVDMTKTAPQSVAITEEQNGQTFKVRVGDEAVVTLAAAPGLGNFWQLAPLNSPVAVLAGTERAAIPPAMPGGSVNHLFHLQIKSAGTVALHFNLLSVRMPGTKLSTFVVTLQAE